MSLLLLNWTIAILMMTTATMSTATLLPPNVFRFVLKGRENNEREMLVFFILFSFISRSTRSYHRLLWWERQPEGVCCHWKEVRTFSDRNQKRKERRKIEAWRETSFWAHNSNSILVFRWCSLLFLVLTQIQKLLKCITMKMYPSSANCWATRNLVIRSNSPSSTSARPTWIRSIVKYSHSFLTRSHVSIDCCPSFHPSSAWGSFRLCSLFQFWKHSHTIASCMFFFSFLICSASLNKTSLLRWRSRSYTN